MGRSTQIFALTLIFLIGLGQGQGLEAGEMGGNWDQIALDGDATNGEFE